ncbi:MAG: hypothetical protein MUE81_16035 [Thermoflexibacter sp.]|nr:hypothetical protein [Thermoflexibacter sp.]
MSNKWLIYCILFLLSCGKLSDEIIPTGKEKCLPILEEVYHNGTLLSKKTYEYDEQKSLIKYTFQNQNNTFSTNIQIKYNDRKQIIERLYTSNALISDWWVYEYNSFDSLVKETNKLSDDFFAYEYDSRKNLIRKTSKNSVITWEYNDKNLMTKFEIRQENFNYILLYEYNEKGNWTRKEETSLPNKIITLRVFDNVGNLVKKTLQKTGKEQLSQAWEYEYDAQQKLILEKFMNENLYVGYAQYIYNNKNLLEKIIYQDSKRITTEEEWREYNAENYLSKTQKRDSQGRIFNTTTYTYHINGKIQEENSSNGADIYLIRKYDIFGNKIRQEEVNGTNNWTTIGAYDCK